MATLPSQGAVIALPNTMPPMPAVARILARFDRPQIEAFLAVAIDLLDTIDGDPDAEEPDLEDSFVLHPADGPGCPVADSHSDQAWIEWHTMRGSMKRGPSPNPGHEDAEEDDEAEEDDPSGQNDEDGINTGDHGLYYSGPGCPLSDPDVDYLGI